MEMNNAIWIVVIPILAMFANTVFDHALQRWFPGPQASSASSKPTVKAAASQTQREIRRSLLWPSWTICVVSLGLLVWQLGRRSEFNRADVLLIVSYAFLFLFSIGLVFFAQFVVAIARVMEKYDKPKT